MFPPSAPGGVTHIDLSALSGIAGSISIACWVVVFSPQIIENFRRRSAEGLSVTFIIIWLLGDVFNILGAILQGVLPTMIILAVYYTLADIVLLLQVWYYRGFTFTDRDISDSPNTPDSSEHETSPLLQGNGHVGSHGDQNQAASTHARHHRGSHQDDSNSQAGFRERSGSFSALGRHLSIDGAHLSPATPLLDTPKPNQQHTSTATSSKTLTTVQTFLFNTFAILLVCAAGVLGWYISAHASTHPTRHHKHHPSNPNPSHDKQEQKSLDFDLWGQIFGYLCAVLYLASRVPQLLLNYRRKSTDGISLLFFLFACIGNLTYDMSIFAFDATPYCQAVDFNTTSLATINSPATISSLTADHCAPGEKSAIYARYIAVNASWIAGSMGTLLLDLAIFVQFFMYRGHGESS